MRRIGNVEQTLFLGASLTVALALNLSGGAMAQESSPEARASPPATPGSQVAVDAILHDVEGNDVGGVMLSDIVEPGVQVQIFVDAGTLSPGEHGTHIHERGLCEANGDEPFSSAGAHYNPTGAQHGGLGNPEAHAGDLGNITVEEDGSANVVIPTDRFTIEELNDEDGSALVIHADQDDLTTDPSGKSGSRVLCAVIFPPVDERGTGALVEGTPIAEAIQSGLATALPDVDEPQPDVDDASPEPVQ